MKSLVKKSLVGVMMAVSLLATGCDNNKPSPSVEESDNVLEFVAVTSTSYDAEITVGQHAYTFDLLFKKDNKVSFNATCTKKAPQGGGGPGGGGFPGGGFPGGGGPGGGPAAGEETSTSTTEEEEDLTTFNFAYEGSWTLEQGYGYIINLSDGNNTIIHTDFNKNQGRHEFYYNVKTSEGSSTTLFQAKDANFRSTLAKDYKTWDERDSKYIFEAKATGNNNSLAFAYLYAHKDNSVVINEPSGSARSVTLGLSWKLENNLFVLINNNQEIVSEMSINSDHPGFRLSYNSKAFFCSTNTSIANSQMTNADFDGKTLYQFVGSYTTSGPDGGTKEVELNLTNNENKMFLYSGGTLSKKGTYTFENEKFTLTFDGEDPVEINKVDGKYTFSFQIKTTGFFAQTIDVVTEYIPGN